MSEAFVKGMDILQKLNHLEYLESKIKEMFDKYCPDYPDSEASNHSNSQLYAISQALDGINLAVSDWQKFGSYLKERYKFNNEEWFGLWEKAVPEQFTIRVK